MEPRRILVLAPHPDDEIVACGIAALRARAVGARVFVLYLTTGVPARDALWPWQRRGHAARLSCRRAEARVAATLFGLEPIGSLDYPSRHLRNHLDAAAAEIGRAIMEHGAEALWVPAFEGAHQDHDAANALAAFQWPFNFNRKASGPSASGSVNTTWWYSTGSSKPCSRVHHAARAAAWHLGQCRLRHEL